MIMKAVLNRIGIITILLVTLVSLQTAIRGSPIVVGGKGFTNNFS